jgi:hypothetical protein
MGNFLMEAGCKWKMGMNQWVGEKFKGNVATEKGLLTRTVCALRGRLSEPHQEWIRSFCALLGQRPSSLVIFGYRSISVASLMKQ